MRKHKRFVSITALVLAVLMVLGIVTSIVSGLFAQASTLNEIEGKISQAESAITSKKGQVADIDSQMGDLQGKLSDLQSQEDTYLEQVDVLQEQVQLLRERIVLTGEQIELYEGMIEEKAEQLAITEQQEEEQLELYKQRIRAMEERGSLNYIQIILSAKSFGDLVTKISDINEILDYDQSVFEELEQYRISVGEYKAELEASMDELEELIAALQADEEELERQIEELQEAIDAVQALIESNKIEQATLQAAKEQLNAEMLSLAQNVESLTAEKQEIIKAMQEAAAAGESVGGGGVSSGVVSGSGMYMWPSDSSSAVTSEFGPRKSPGGIGSTNHQGMDIGAAYGTNVLAAAAGEVVQAGWNGGYGNYIMINHGNGNYTAYAHMSSLVATKGEMVIQGQIIGKVGSTGNSTGPHLHFEVYAGGSRVNPRNYL